MSLSKKTKIRIIFGIIGGLAFALTMWLFDYYNNEAHNVKKFLFHFLAFGLFQALISVFYIKKDENQK